MVTANSENTLDEVVTKENSSMKTISVAALVISIIALFVALGGLR